MMHRVRSDRKRDFDQFLQVFGKSVIDSFSSRHSPNLLPQLLEAWQIDRDHCHLSRKLREQVRVGAALSVLRSECFGDRFVWWPNGLQPGCYVAVVGSRVGERLSSKHRWLKTLEAIVTSLDPRRDVLVSLRGTTCDPFWSCFLPDTLAPLLSFLERAQLSKLSNEMIGSRSNCRGRRMGMLSTMQEPAVRHEHRDAALLAFADVVVVTRLTVDGSLFPIVTKLLQQRPGHLPVLLATDAGEIPLPIVDQLVVAGARVWSNASLLRTTP